MRSQAARTLIAHQNTYEIGAQSGSELLVEVLFVILAFVGFTFCLFLLGCGVHSAINGIQGNASGQSRRARRRNVRQQYRSAVINLDENERRGLARAVGQIARQDAYQALGQTRILRPSFNQVVRPVVFGDGGLAVRRPALDTVVTSAIGVDYTEVFAQFDEDVS